MRSRLYYALLALLALGFGGFVAFSLTLGQDHTKALNRAIPVVPQDGNKKQEQIDSLPGKQAPIALVPDNNTLPPVDRSNANSPETIRLQEAQAVLERGAQWLARMSQVNGLFLYGWHPALNTQLEGDDYLHQLAAVLAMARSARYLNEKNYAAIATQSVLRFLDDTAVDAKETQVRFTKQGVDANRLAAAGLLVQTIHELPNPQADILDKAEQLCNFIRIRQQPDGSLHCSDDRTNSGVNSFVDHVAAGRALTGLMVSQRHRPQAWKLETVNKALPYYQNVWRTNKSIELVVAHTPAYTQAFLLTKSRVWADFVFEMNDWLCSLQYDQIDPKHQSWWGGFKSWSDGKAVPTIPHADNAACAESIIEACRVARESADVQRHDVRYKPALELWRAFAARLQYVEANTLHFAPEYRRDFLLGGFHATPDDGKLRIDYTQQAVCALVQYLTYVARA